MRYMRTILIIIFLITAFSACQAGEPPSAATDLPENQIEPILPGSIPESTATQNPISTPDLEDTDMSTPVTPAASTEAIVALAKQHLAQRLSIAADQIVLSEVKPVMWRDAGLGCPKPGVDYIQMETPGYRILLEAGGETYNYHTDEGKRFVLCNQ